MWNLLTIRLTSLWCVCASEYMCSVSRGTLQCVHMCATIESRTATYSVIASTWNDAKIVLNGFNFFLASYSKTKSKPLYVFFNDFQRSLRNTQCRFIRYGIKERGKRNWEQHKKKRIPSRRLPFLLIKFCAWARRWPAASRPSSFQSQRS